MLPPKRSARSLFFGASKSEDPGRETPPSVGTTHGVGTAVRRPRGPGRIGLALDGRPDTRRLLRGVLLLAGLAGCHGRSTPDGGYAFPTPIQHLFVVIKENHTFDNYFTGLPGADTVTTAPHSDGTVIQRPVAPDGGLPVDPCHSHACAITAFADGGMNGFDKVPGDEPNDLGFSRYTPDQLPAYWTYAQDFVLCDHYFTTLAGPSTPNHFATLVAQTPFYDNPLCLVSCGTSGCQAVRGSTIVPAYDQDTCATLGNVAPCFDIPSVVDFFGDALTWRAYGDSTASGPDTSFFLIKSIGGDPSITSAHVRISSQLIDDVTAGDVPNFVHVDSVPLPDQEGPPEDPCAGENWTVQLVNAVMQGPYWNSSAVVFVWDDWGGWYDHVPPAAEFCANGTFFNPGFRVPALIISPYARPGYVLHTVTEHASVARLVEELFGLPMMHDRDPHARDAKVGSLMEAFDFTQAPRPPVILQPKACP